MRKYKILKDILWQLPITGVIVMGTIGTEKVTSVGLFKKKEYRHYIFPMNVDGSVAIPANVVENSPTFFSLEKGITQDNIEQGS